jgi:hypothetical protein
MIRSDLYTKAVLTVIAVCLAVLCTQSLRSPVPAYAQAAGGAGQRVIVAGFDQQAMKAGMPVWLAGGNGSIPVVITGGNIAIPVTTQGQSPLQVSISK